jgi:hypothetical protein
MVEYSCVGILKGIVSRDGPWVDSLGLNNLPRQGFTAGKSCVKKLWCNKQGSCRCKMAGTGIQSFAKFRAQISAECHKPHDRLKPLAFHAQTYCGMPTTTRQYTAECQLLGKIWPRNATDQTVLLINFPRNATNRGIVLSPWHSAVRKLAFRGKIWTRNLAKDWIPVPPILHRQLPCLLRHKCLPRNFPDIRPICGELFRPKLHKNGLS